MSMRDARRAQRRVGRLARGQARLAGRRCLRAEARSNRRRVSASGSDGVDVEKRKQQRTRKRLTCEILLGAARHAALVRDLSAAGLFVQTRVRLEPDARVRLIFGAQDGLPAFEVEARVARQRMVPPRLQSAVPGGVGLVVIDPPAGFQEMVARGAASGAPEAAPEPSEVPSGAPAGIRTFRVRMIERDKPNARVFTVRSESLHGARARALARAGHGWKIADIQEI